MHAPVVYSARRSYFMLWGTSVFHRRVVVDIRSTYFSFLSPGIAIDILHSAPSFLVRLFFTIYF